jgi:hypothetical protein
MLNFILEISSTHSAQMVQNCLEEMQKAIVQARKQAMPTHFVSIPIFDPTLRQQYSDLVEQIRSDEDLQVSPFPGHYQISLYNLYLFSRRNARIRLFLCRPPNSTSL